MVFTFSHFISYSTLDSKLGQTTTRTVSGLRASFPFTSLLNSSTPPTSTDLVSASSRFSSALGSSSGSTFLSLPGSTLSSALESCLGDLMEISLELLPLEEEVYDELNLPIQTGSDSSALYLCTYRSSLSMFSTMRGWMLAHEGVASLNHWVLFSLMCFRSLGSILLSH